MIARVTVILVARNGEAFLRRTLPALAAQTRRPDVLVAVDAGSTDASADLLAASGPTQLVSARGQHFGAAVNSALRLSPQADSDSEWLWLLAHDNAPEPTALEQLLGAVEVAPSVAIAGPKLMRWDEKDVIVGFGETLTNLGASIALVDGELDQAQHDAQDDVMGVAAAGMLVRRSLFVALGGFDPGLPTIDAALDFSVRARLAGFRVVVVPGAQVASAGGPEFFGRRTVSPGRQARQTRAAQLHRRLVYAPTAALAVHWLTLLPLAVVRALGQLLLKRPGFVAGEFQAALSASFTGGVGAARARLQVSRQLGWAAVSPLRMRPREVRERRAQAREPGLASGPLGEILPRATFVAHGGLWVVVLTAVAGVLALAPLLGSASLTGGGLLPLSSTVGELWANIGYGSRNIGVGFVGSADPFAYVLAALGSLTFWSPSLSIVLLVLLSLPLSALGAWFAARRLARRSWIPAVAAIIWAFAPMLLGSVSAGHLGALIVHILLPWLVLAGLSAPRSWSASAAAALLFAAAAASAPVLVLPLLVLWLALLFSHPVAFARLVAIPIPAAALFAPLVVAQFAAGTPLGLLAEPGVPVAGAATSAWQLALGSALPGFEGWTALLQGFAPVGTSPAVVVAALTLPFVLLAMLGLFVPGSRRAIPALAVALIGFVTAVISARIEVGVAGGAAAAIWPGAALSLLWIGLLGAAIVALDGAGRVAIPLGVLATVSSVIVAVPLLGAFYFGSASVLAGGPRILPALITAEAASHPSVATLVLDPAIGTGVSARIQRGSGTTLDDQSTIDATRTKFDATERRIAVVAGNLGSASGQNARMELARYSIGFVLLEPASGAEALHQRTADALDSNPALAAVGNTGSGRLWRVVDSTATGSGGLVSNTATPFGRGVLIAQGAVFALTLLLGFPTMRRARRRNATGSAPDEPAHTFDEVEND